MSTIEKPKLAVGYRTPDAQSSNELRQGYAGRCLARIPILQTDKLDPTEYARSTCFAAGYLTVKNAGWRNERPVFDPAKCNGCLKCYMHCPDGAVFKVANDPEACPSNRTDTSIGLDLDFCKGCGICAKSCSTGALSMIPEGEARKAEETAAGAGPADAAGIVAGTESVVVAGAVVVADELAGADEVLASAATTKEGE
ncbi:MAG: 4Fe-4S binding protein [Coriobacteriia bacterium]|nr:4Fe-4S binding protein [Coriobacteriia bacterium]